MRSRHQALEETLTSPMRVLLLLIFIFRPYRFNSPYYELQITFQTLFPTDLPPKVWSDLNFRQTGLPYARGDEFKNQPALGIILGSNRQNVAQMIMFIENMEEG
jgi:hypothetical protein